MDFPRLKIYDVHGNSLHDSFHTEMKERIAYLRAAKEQGKKFLILSQLSPWELARWIWSALCAEVAFVPLHPSLPESQISLHIDQLPENSYFSPDSPISKPSSRNENLNNLGAVLFTSGSTGRPRAMALSREALRASTEMQESHLGVSKFIWYMNLSPSHIGGLNIVTRAFFLNSKLVFSALPGVEETIFSFLIENESPGISMVPTQLLRLIRWMEHKKKCLPLTAKSLILVGGAPLSTELLEKGITLGLKVQTTYGMTEVCSQIATERATGGGLIPLPEVGVFTQMGKESSEIMVRSPSIAEGEFVEGSLIPMLKNRDGFWATGDWGNFNGETLQVHGRKSDAINSGGLKFFPFEIEAALSTHPGLKECAIIGKPDLEWGTIATAFCVVSDPKIQEIGLRDFLRSKIDSRKIPKKWIFVEKLPTTLSGKIDRLLLQKTIQSRKPTPL